MRKLVAVLAVAALAMPALGAAGDVEKFVVTADGSFNNNRSGEGYSNGGFIGMPRLTKANQHMGWMSFNGAVGATSGQSLADFIAANGGYSNVQVTLNFKTDKAIAGKLAILSLRSGNVGGLIEDADPDGVSGPGNADPSFVGSSQCAAFRGGEGPYTYTGAGIYKFEDPTLPGAGVPWITPSGRIVSGRYGFNFGPGQMVRYDIDNNGADIDSGMYDGYVEDGSGAGANFWALEDLLGLRQNNGNASGGLQQITDAGQIYLKDAAGNLQIVTGGDVNAWQSYVLDEAFLMDIAAGAEHKGLVFTSQISNAGLSADWNNVAFYAKEQAGGVDAAYLSVTVLPEPATLAILALGGLALLRRRR